MAHHPLPSLALAFLLLLGPRHTVAAVSGTVTISALGDYSSLRACAASCLYGQPQGSDPSLVDDGLGCAAPYENNCYCRVDQASQASRFISSCASKYCTLAWPDPDITSALNVYRTYCSSNGYTAPASATATQTSITPIGSSLRTTITGTSSVRSASSTARPTGTAIPPNPPDDKGDSKLSTAAQVGIIVPVICSVVGLIFGIWFKIYKYKMKKKLRQSSYAAPMIQAGPPVYIQQPYYPQYVRPPPPPLLPPPRHGRLRRYLRA